MRALVVKEPWATLIITGEKTLEIRNMRTKKIGEEIYIAKAGSKTLIGKVIIDKCEELSSDKFNSLVHIYTTQSIIRPKKKFTGGILGMQCDLIHQYLMNIHRELKFG